MRATNTNNVSKIHTLYKTYDKTCRDLWESFSLINFFTPLIQEAIRRNTIPCLKHQGLYNRSPKELSKKNTYGALTALRDKGIKRRTIIESFTAFEAFLCDLLFIVYNEYPLKISTEKGENLKIDISNVIKANNKEEIVNNLIQRKIDSLFYGNKEEIFTKDKSNIGFNTIFKKDDNTIQEFSKTIATRNILIHNDGKVNRKFTELTNSNHKLGTRIELTNDLIKKSCLTLSRIATLSTCHIIQNIYGSTPSGILKRRQIFFNNSSNQKNQK